MSLAGSKLKKNEMEIRSEDRSTTRNEMDKKKKQQNGIQDSALEPKHAER